MQRLKKLLLVMLIILVLPIVYSESMWDYLTKPYADTLYCGIDYCISNASLTNVNSSEYWDNLDTPADITYDDISGGDVEALGYTGFFNFIQGVVGQLSMNGDPWYLGGTNLEINQNLQVNNTVIENDIDVGGFVTSDLNPSPTLTQSLGTGANRWLNFFVQTINSENIETYGITALDNVTTDTLCNSTGSCFNLNELNISGSVGNTSFNSSWTAEQYVPYEGAIRNVNLSHKNLTEVDTIRFSSGVITNGTWEGFP